MWNKKYSHNILMCDDMNEVFFAGYKCLGYKIDDDQRKLDAVTDLLIRQKPLLLKYENNMIVDYMVNGDVWIAQSWNGMIAKIMKSGKQFKMAIPKEGVLSFIDNMCIPKAAPNKETAELFIDFLMRPKNTARTMEVILYSMPNPAAKAFLPDSLRNNPVMFPSREIIEHMNLTPDRGAFNQKLEQAWTKLKVK